MTPTNIETEVQWLRTAIIPAILKSKHFIADSTLSDKAKANIRVRDVQMKLIGAEESFMLTSCYRATVTLEEGDRGLQTATLIIKKTPRLPQEIFDAIQFAALFSNEIWTYNIILPTIEKFLGQPFNTPRYYFGELRSNAAAIVMQDFAANNWRLAKERVNLSLAHVIVAVRNLGTFHGTGFALKHKCREEFDRIANGLKEARFANDDVHPEWEMICQNSVERIAIATRKYQPQIDEDFLGRYQRMIRQFVLYGREMVKPVEPLVTLCHGDYVRNNVAFKYPDNQDTQEPIDSLMFDLQTTRISSPMLDFATFLSLSTYAEVRQKHFHRIFQEYLGQLTAAFKSHSGLEQVPDFLSHDSMVKEFVRLFPYSISIASHFLMQLVEPQSISSQEMLQRSTTPEKIRQDTLERGGEEVDRELAHQMQELYELVQIHQVDIFKDFDYIVV